MLRNLRLGKKSDFLLKNRIEEVFLNLVFSQIKNQMKFQKSPKLFLHR